MPNGEKRGITVKIDADLHSEVKAYIESHGLTMAEFVSLALEDELHPKIQESEEKTMGKMRTLAFQVDEDLFQRIKDYLQRHNMTQKQFVLGLIEEELDRDLEEQEREWTSEAEDPEEENDEREDSAPVGDFEADPDEVEDVTEGETETADLGPVEGVVDESEETEDLDEDENEDFDDLEDEDESYDENPDEDYDPDEDEDEDEEETNGFGMGM